MNDVERAPRQLKIGQQCQVCGQIIECYRSDKGTCSMRCRKIKSRWTQKLKAEEAAAAAAAAVAKKKPAKKKKKPAKKKKPVSRSAK